MIWVAFIVCAACGMIINPQAFLKFFDLGLEIPESNPTLNYFCDIAAYASMSMNSQCSAFYSLWPTLIRVLFEPTTIKEAAQGFLITATGLWLVSIPLLLVVFQKGLNDRRLGFWVALIYSLSPMAIFRVIGYTESLFGFLSLLLMWALLPREQPRGQWVLWVVFVFTFSLSLTRPALVQFIGSGLGTIFTLGILARLKLEKESWKEFWQRFAQEKRFGLQVTGVIFLAALLGYAVYGTFCVQHGNSFWTPFEAQKAWGKSLAFRPYLLLLPKSPLIDILALYFPVLLLATAWLIVLAKYKPLKLPSLLPFPIFLTLAFYPPLWILAHTLANLRTQWLRKLQPLTHSLTPLAEICTQSYLFWFSLYFTASHSVISFFTQDRLVSLGRYVFAQPFIFLGLGYVYISLNHHRKLWPIMWLSGIEAAYLVNNWVRYGSHLWLG